jgi:hypothetical protein
MNHKYAGKEVLEGPQSGQKQLKWAKNGDFAGPVVSYPCIFLHGSPWGFEWDILNFNLGDSDHPGKNHCSS